MPLYVNDPYWTGVRVNIRLLFFNTSVKKKLSPIRGLVASWAGKSPTPFWGFFDGDKCGDGQESDR